MAVGSKADLIPGRLSACELRLKCLLSESGRSFLAQRRKGAKENS
jgi:hypothetical protein